jgi:hypothetical protein
MPMRREDGAVHRQQRALCLLLALALRRALSTRVTPLELGRQRVDMMCLCNGQAMALSCMNPLMNRV